MVDLVSGLHGSPLVAFNFPAKLETSPMGMRIGKEMLEV